MRTRIYVMLAVLVAGAMSFVSCQAQTIEPTPEPGTTPLVGQEQTPTPEQEGQTAVASDGLPDIDPTDVSGEIVDAGSSTVYPLAERIAQRFRGEGFAGTISVASIGSGAGFGRFCKGEIDIANASRPINDIEMDGCRGAGLEPVPFRIGTDALAVAVNGENGFAHDVTMEELALIFSDRAEMWADVRPEWPDEPIERFIPGTDSGTLDYFVEQVLDGNEQSHLNANNTQLSEDDNTLVQGVLSSPYAVGYLGHAYYAANEARLRALTIDGVEPTRETVDDGTYPLVRPLFLYSAPSIMQQKPQIAAFIAFFLQHVNEEILDAGYFPASERALAESRAAWWRAGEGE